MAGYSGGRFHLRQRPSGVPGHCRLSATRRPRPSGSGDRLRYPLPVRGLCRHRRGGDGGKRHHQPSHHPGLPHAGGEFRHPGRPSAPGASTSPPATIPRSTTASSSRPPPGGRPHQTVTNAIESLHRRTQPRQPSRPCPWLQPGKRAWSSTWSPGPPISSTSRPWWTSRC